MNAFFEDFTRDIPRGLSTRYLKQQTAPQARWQSPDVIFERAVLAYGPYSGGQSHQRHPLLITCTMPLMTRRSSTRGLPRTSVGNNGLI